MNSVGYIALFLLIAIVHGNPTPGDTTMLQMSANKCREGTSITKELLIQLLKGDGDVQEPEESTKCYFKCFFQDLGMMSSDGSIVLDAKHSHFSDCSAKATEANLCDRAYSFDRCVHMQFPLLPIV